MFFCFIFRHHSTIPDADGDDIDLILDFDFYIMIERNPSKVLYAVLDDDYGNSMVMHESETHSECWFELASHKAKYFETIF